MLYSTSNGYDYKNVIICTRNNSIVEITTISYPFHSSTIRYPLLKKRDTREMEICKQREMEI